MAYHQTIMTERLVLNVADEFAHYRHLDASVQYASEHKRVVAILDKET